MKITLALILIGLTLFQTQYAGKWTVMMAGRSSALRATLTPTTAVCASRGIG